MITIDNKQLYYELKEEEEKERTKVEVKWKYLA